LKNFKNIPYFKWLRRLDQYARHLGARNAIDGENGVKQMLEYNGIWPIAIKEQYRLDYNIWCELKGYPYTPHADDWPE
jgi:hypothetical protein